MLDNAHVTDLMQQMSALAGTRLQESTYFYSERRLEMSFVHWEGHTIDVQCLGVLLYSASALDQDGKDSEVISAVINTIEEKDVGILERLGYSWIPATVAKEEFHYPLISLQLNGDVCVVIVCSRVLV